MIYIKIVKKIKSIITDIISKIKSKLIIIKYKYIKSKENVRLGEFKNDYEIIVSLTTIPSRINTVWLTIESIFRQEYKPDKIILWLGSELFKDITIPNKIIDLQKKGLEVRYCDDLICHTKYYYTLKENPNAIIITIDDDILYPKTMISELVHTYLMNKDCIVCHRAHEITIDENYNINEYNKWNYESKGVSGPSNTLLQTGVSGVLYPPGSLNEEVLNKEVFMELCPKADDIWLKCMALLNNTPIIKVKSKSKHFPVIGGTQEVALWKSNVKNNGNDVQLNNILNKYKIKSRIIDNL